MKCICNFLDHEMIRGCAGSYPDHVDSIFHALIDMLLVGNFSAYLHPEFPLYLLQPLEAGHSGSFKTARMGTGFPYSGTEYMDSEFMQPFRRHHHLQLRLGAARTGNDDRRYALVKKSPLGDRYGVKGSVHCYLSIFFILFAS